MYFVLIDLIDNDYSQFSLITRFYNCCFECVFQTVYAVLQIAKLK